MIIGITGTLGAGKGTVVEFLKQKGFAHYSVRDFLTKEIEKRNLPVNIDSMVLVANDLREKNSPSYIVKQLYQQASKQGGNCIIESIRSIGEVEALKSNRNFYLIAVDTPSDVRYSRIILRSSETDNLTYEEFIEKEKRQMQSLNPNEQNIKKCMEMADFIVHNDKDFQYLKRQIDLIYDRIKIPEPKIKEVKPVEKSVEKKPIPNIIPTISPPSRPYERPSWDEYFLKMAALVAERSTCLRHHVGAIIVRDKRVLTTGYNGAAIGKKDCTELGCNKDRLGLGSGKSYEECRAIHAEQNAIIQAGIHGIVLKDSILYLTHTPCKMCAKEIVQTGIKKIISYQDFSGDLGAKEYLEESKIEIIKIPRPSNILSFKD
ncbi:MAG: deaminase [archaeon]